MTSLEVLCGVTLLIILLGIALLWKTRSMAVMLGLGLIYYFSLYGAWKVLEHAIFGIGRYNDIELNLFSVHPCPDYENSIFLYGFFIVAIEVTLLITWVTNTQDVVTNERVGIRHIRLLTTCFVMLLISLAIMGPHLQEAMASNQPGYLTTRFSDDPLYSIHQIASGMAFLMLSIGFASCFGGQDNRFIIACSNVRIKTFYFVLLGVTVTYETVLGNRLDMTISAICGILFYLRNVRHVHLARLIAPALLANFALSIVAGLRGIPLGFLFKIFSGEIAVNWSEVFFPTSDSAEMYAAHLSMYGSLSEHIRPSFGISVLPFLTSIIPHALWKNRPSDVYAYYAAGMGFPEGRGFTIHHATAWYLNFGVVGVALGGILLALVWSYCERLTLKEMIGHGRFRWALGCVALPSFVAHIPGLLRTGFEGYKALCFETLLLPALFLAIMIVRLDPVEVETANDFLQELPLPGEHGKKSGGACWAEADVALLHGSSEGLAFPLPI
jgi:hypothetical protein